jgi:uncharacterized Zn-binding protein involved in type VI secretion
MGKKMIVENDKVEGTDTHAVFGDATNPAAPPPTIQIPGTGSFDYVGKMTDQLSDFVKIAGKPLALKNSKSSLNSGETSPSGKHAGPAGKSLVPPNLLAATTLSITDPVGPGNPSATSGSTFVKVASTPVLLDGDKIDTCGTVPMASTVTSENQDFVSCSA